MLLSLDAFAQVRDLGISPTRPFADPKWAQVPFGAISYYYEPWRSYMDTWSASRLLNCLGIVYSSNPLYGAAECQVLADAGFKHMRFEIGWGAFSYASPSTLSNASAINGLLQAMRYYGLRPLILLNANDGYPCPNVPVTVSVLAAPAGATSITVTAGAAQIVPGKSGFWSTFGYGTMCKPMIASVDLATGICQLSCPLPAAVATGNVELRTMLFHPFSDPGYATYAETLAGWQQYVANVCAILAPIFGAGGWDMEVWNEMGFGTSFLDERNYYTPARGTSNNATYTSHGVVYKGMAGGILIATTCDYVSANYPGVKIINGFTNQTPFGNASQMAYGQTGYSRHWYSDSNVTQDFNAICGNTRGGTKSGYPNNSLQAPINALGGKDGQLMPDNVHVWSGSFFVPDMIQVSPEAPALASKVESLIPDLAPYTIANRGRNVTSPFGAKAEFWESEYNSSRQPWLSTVVAATGKTYSDPSIVALSHFIGAKNLLRSLVFYSHKGIDVLCTFADNAGGDIYYSVMPQAFYKSLNGFSLTQASIDNVGPQLHALKNLTSYVRAQTGSLSAITPLTVTGLIDRYPRVEFRGDGTAAHPDVFRVDNLLVAPFQTSDHSYVVAVYDVTRNAYRNYNVNPDLTDVRNYVAPDDEYEITLSGFASAPVTFVEVYDPIGNWTSAEIIKRSDNTSITFLVKTTDYPRLLLIKTR